MPSRFRKALRLKGAWVTLGVSLGIGLGCSDPRVNEVGTIAGSDGTDTSELASDECPGERAQPTDDSGAGVSPSVPDGSVDLSDSGALAVDTEAGSIGSSPTTPGAARPSLGTGPTNVEGQECSFASTRRCNECIAQSWKEDCDIEWGALASEPCAYSRQCAIDSCFCRDGCAEALCICAASCSRLDDGCLDRWREYLICASSSCTSECE